MKFLFLASLSVFSMAASAQRYTVIGCEVNDPCKYSSPKDLGFCVGSVKIKFNDPISGNHMVISEKKQGYVDLYRIAAEIPVTSFSAYSISGMDSTGDDWFKINVTGKSAFGVLTLGQDFQFPIYCK